MLCLLIQNIIQQATPYSVDFSPGNPQTVEFQFKPKYLNSGNYISINIQSGMVNLSVLQGQQLIVSWNQISETQVKEITNSLLTSYEFTIKIAPAQGHTILTFSYEQFTPIIDNFQNSVKLEGSTMQVLFLNCDVSDAKISAPVGVLLYFTKDQAYLSTDSCVNSSTTFCGYQELTVKDFTILRGVIKSNQEITIITVEQQSFVDVTLDGIQHVMKVPQSIYCYGFIKTDLQPLVRPLGLRPHIKFLTIVGTHVHPYNHGYVQAQVATDPLFSNIIGYSISGDIIIPRLLLQQLINATQTKLYIRVLQSIGHNNLDVALTTDMKILLMPNLNIIAPLVETPATLTPIQSNADDVSKFEGSLLSSCNFMKSHPLVKIIDSTEPPKYYYAARFRTTLSSKDSIIANLLSSVNHIPTINNHQGQSFDFFEQSYYSSAYIYQADINPPILSSDDIIPLGDVIFSLASLQTSGATYPINTSLVFAQIISANIKDNIEVITGNEFVYFAVNRDKTSLDKNGITIDIQLLDCAQKQFSVYHSQFNPLPNMLQHESHYGQFKNKQKINIDFTQLSQKVDYFSIQLHQQSCKVQLQVSYLGESVPVVIQGNQNDFVLDLGDTSDYQVFINSSHVYNKQGYLKLQILEATANDFEIQYAVTAQHYQSAVQDLLPRQILFQDKISSNGQQERFFSTKSNENLFIKFSASKLSENKQLKCRFVFQTITTSDNLQQQNGQLALRNQLNIFQFTNENNQEIRIKLNTTKDVLVYFCQQKVPDFSDYAMRCVQLSMFKDYYFIKHNFEGYSKGINYFGITTSNAELVYTISILKHHKLELSMPNVVEINNLDYKFVLYPENLVKTDSIITEVINCENCAICFSKTNPDIQFNKASKVGDCDFLIGILQDQKNPLQQSNELLAAFGTQQLFGTIISYQRVGNFQMIEFQANVVKRAMFDTMNLATLGWTLKQEDTQDGVTFYPNAYYKFLLPKQQLLSQTTISITIGPQINEQQPAVSVISFHYSVYLSTVSKTPNQFRFEYESNIEIGITTISLDKEQINKIIENSCVTDTTCYLYLGVFAQKQSSKPYSITQTYLALESTNTIDNVVQQLKFHTANNEGIKNNGNRTLYNFDVFAKPMSFILSPCKGYPTMRAGTTDYFYRSVGADDKIDVKEMIYKSNSAFAQEVLFSVRPATRYSQLGDWFIEIGDFRQINDNWAADLFVGIQDPRPGIPIKPITVQKTKTLQVIFKPSIPVGPNQNIQSLEYNVFSLPNLKTEQMYIPNTSCGLLMGGKQLLTNWITFDQWDDYYSLQTDIDFSSDPSSEHFISVVVRQKETNLSNSYKAVIIDKDGNPTE
ncbi:hypothetical protein SS50377_24570 [Spironucleus salmonicida]|uniref:Uncharacterized protein n=1 Tax=Spironucleus salmonicida TaxID=348837 RepID=V6LLE5_9EUKA|nr:hypothetical protein SS50377_24570 [Spironucleus salmonicida]|eukprot:EST44571.1 Hypothetical protein SS50377_15573 [Spironucleus salmonicida]